MEKVRYERIDQEVYETQLECGLTVVVFPKPGMQQKYASLSTHYGGMDREFIRPGSDEPTRVPDGIAHFLEHKLFDQPDGTNILQRFTAMGASPNAFTGPYYTVYHFTAVDSFEPALDLLLDFVQEPYFTEESVAKEQGIIEQEIRMGLDSPARMVYYNLLEAMYHAHPARIRVIGSVESVRSITPQLLYECYDTFYHPSNMIVTVAGDLDPHAVLARIEADVAQRGYRPRDPIRRMIPAEPPEVRQADIRHELRVSRPSVLVGFKGAADRRPGEDARGYQRRLIAGQLGIQAVLGRNTPLYWDLYADGTLTDGFHAGYTAYTDAGYVVAGGESENASRLVEAVTTALLAARDRGIPQEPFEEVRKRSIGSMLSAVDEPRSMADQFVTHRFRGLDFMANLDLYQEVSIEESQAFLAGVLDAKRRVVSMVEPLKGDDKR